MHLMYVICRLRCDIFKKEMEESAREVPRCLDNLMERRLGWSRVSEAASALQAVEMGLSQDPVDLQVRRRVSRPSQV